MKPTEMHGFSEIGTGGGCTALYRQEPDGVEILITRANDTTAPDDLGEPVLVGVNDADGRCILQRQFPTLAAAYGYVKTETGR